VSFESISHSLPEDKLLPDRYPQKDLFICDVADAVLKDVMQHIEHPFYSLSKKPQTDVQLYRHNDAWIKIIPSVVGQATIYDKDILIYCISQIMHKLKKNEPVSPRVKISSRDLLMFSNRGTSGRDYKRLEAAIERLRGTVISTNIRTGDMEQTDTFGLIDSASVQRKYGIDGRLIACEIKLSNWVFNAIHAKEVLTLHPDYFRLEKPIERRVYEIARKHCGNQKTWSISLEKLLKKSGSKGSLKKFRQSIKVLTEANHLPDYQITYNRTKDIVLFLNRDKLKLTSYFDEAFPILLPETYEKAKRIAPDQDVYALEEEWRIFWDDSGRHELDSADAAFLGFCRYKQVGKSKSEIHT